MVKPLRPANIIKALTKLKILLLILPSLGMFLQIPTFSTLKAYYHSHFVDSYYTVFLIVFKPHSKYHLQLIGGSNKFTETMFILSISEVPKKDSEYLSPCINSGCSFQLQ